MKTRTSLFYFILVTLLIISDSALAVCKWMPGHTGPVKSSVSFGDIYVPRDAPVGHIVASEYVSGSKNNVFTCTTAWIWGGRTVLFNTLSSYGNRVFNTNISGIGIRIKQSGHDGWAYPFEEQGEANSPFYLQSYQVELVKTSANSVGAGEITTGEIGRALSVTDPRYYTSLSLTGRNKIIPVACTLKNSVIDVKLANVSSLDFKGVGTTAKPKGFNIDLDCDENVRVSVTLDGPTAGPASVLALNAGEDQAKGIGIQLLKGTTPIKLGSPVDFGTVPKAGNFSVPLIARYYQLSDPIDGGTANANATFTMAYN